MPRTFPRLSDEGQPIPLARRCIAVVLMLVVFGVCNPFSHSVADADESIDVVDSVYDVPIPECSDWPDQTAYGSFGSPVNVRTVQSTTAMLVNHAILRRDNLKYDWQVIAVRWCAIQVIRPLEGFVLNDVWHTRTLSPTRGATPHFTTRVAIEIICPRLGCQPVLGKMRIVTSAITYDGIPKEGARFTFPGKRWSGPRFDD